MGGRGGLGGSVSRWNFEVKVKNATLRSVKKKLGQPVPLKKTHTLWLQQEQSATDFQGLPSLPDHVPSFRSDNYKTSTFQNTK